MTDPALPAGLRTIDIEREALERLHEALRSPPLAKAFQEAAKLIADSTGRVIVSGMGKSGLVARKIAATLASTGTPAFFIHPAEAGHGDLGMITNKDIALILSWSGETDELSDIITYCQRFKVPLIAITSQSSSNLAINSDIVMTLPTVREACPHQLAPTSSTIMQAVIGDALAIALVDLRGFSPDDFRVFHPRGQLGTRLLRVTDLMGTGDQIPRVTQDASILEAMFEMSLKRFGIAAVVDTSGSLIGAFSDGDLRRSLTIAKVDSLVREHMSQSPLVIDAHRLASEAVAIMNERNVMQLFVTEGTYLTGIVHLHDILRAGVL